MGLSVVVITKNEEANIARCLDSVSWADEIIVIDSRSTDCTEQLALERGAAVYQNTWTGYGPAKREGVARATQEWILSIDADEEVTPTLAGQIKEIVAGTGSCDGYFVNRRTNFLGHWIGHCGWYPDPVLRLFRRAAGNFNAAVVHEKVEVDGPVGRLTGELRHYSYPTMELYMEKFNVYTTLGAEQAHRRGKRAGWFDIVLRPPVAFIKHYVIRQGFRDGMPGFIVSFMSSVAVFVKYTKLRLLNKKD